MNDDKVIATRSGRNSKNARERLPKSPPVSTNFNGNEQARMMAVLAEVEKIRLSARRELALARNIRVEAERYLQEMEMKARSQAQLLILQARLATQKEITELKQKTSEEIQKILADIRMVRITAQEELEIQRRFTDATRIKALSFNLQKETAQKPEKETVKV
ncbi:hypothetical protein ACFLUB_02525 [Chloroflexota bacterium]